MDCQTVTHTFEEHKKRFNGLCRICFERIPRYLFREKKVFHCENLAEDLLDVYGINVQLDNHEKHSKVVCPNCRRNMCRFKNNEITKPSYIDSPGWKKFDSSIDIVDCSSCLRMVAFLLNMLSKFSRS